jgi:hypothetical protein
MLEGGATVVRADASSVREMPTRIAWIGDGAPRMEVAHIERGSGDFTAVGTQLGAVYELRYRLAPRRLAIDLVGGRSLELDLGDADFFDLGWSPLFNSLPVIRDELLRGRVATRVPDVLGRRPVARSQQIPAALPAAREWPRPLQRR